MRVRKLAEKLLEKHGIWGLLIIFSIAYSLIGILRYNHFLAGGYDLPHYTQAIWQYSQGKLAKVTIFGNIYILGDHFEPILILFAPIYRIFPNPQTIIIIQAMISVLSAYPIYLFTRKVIKNPYLRLIPSIVYLLHPSLQYALDYDFHTSTIMILPLSLIYLALEDKKMVLYWISLFLIFLTKEDGAIFTLFLGAYQLFRYKDKKLALFTILLSALWFYLVQFKLIPLFYGGNKEATIFIDFYFLGKTIPEMIKNAVFKPWLLITTLFNNEEKFKTIVFLFGSFSFLPLFSLFSLFNSLAFLAEKFYSNTNSRWLFNQYHHANILPVLVFGYIYVVKNLKKRNEKLAQVLLMTSFIFILLINKLWHLPITRLGHLKYFNESQQEKDIKKAFKNIPLKASVSAQFPFTAYLSQRNEIYLFPEAEDRVEYVILTLNGLPTYPLSKDEVEKRIKRYKNNKRIKLVYEKENTYIFQRF